MSHPYFLSDPRVSGRSELHFEYINIGFQWSDVVAKNNVTCLYPTSFHSRDHGVGEGYAGHPEKRAKSARGGQERGSGDI